MQNVQTHQFLTLFFIVVLALPGVTQPYSNQQNTNTGTDQQTKLQNLKIHLQNDTPEHASVKGAEAYLIDRDSLQKMMKKSQNSSSFKEKLETSFEDSATAIPLNDQGKGKLTLQDQSFYHPVLWVVYKGAVYTRVLEKKKELSVTLPIYEPTSDSSVLKIRRHHIPIQKQKNGFHVAEVIILKNTSKKAYTGKQGPETLHFSVPENARNVRYGTMQTPNDQLQSKKPDQSNRIWLYQPILPNRPHQFKITYQLPFQNNQLNFQKPIDYQTEKLRIVVPKGPYQLESNFQIKRDVTPPSGQGQVSMIRTGDLAPGKSIQLSISGNSSAASSSRSPSSAPRSSTNNRGNTQVDSPQYMMLTIGILAVLSFALSLFLLFRLRYSSSTDVEAQHSINQQSINAIRSKLLQQIADLDDLHEQEDLSDSFYETSRKRLKSIITDLDQYKDNTQNN